MNDFDMEQFRLAASASTPNRAKRMRAPLKRFLKGPVPLDWLQRAAALPGVSLHVAVYLRFMQGLTRSQTVRVSPKALLEFGVKNRWAVSRALGYLEEAGLVAVERAPGRCSVATVLDLSRGQNLPGGGEVGEEWR